MPKASAKCCLCVRDVRRWPRCMCGRCCRCVCMWIVEWRIWCVVLPFPIIAHVLHASIFHSITYSVMIRVEWLTGLCISAWFRCVCAARCLCAHTIYSTTFSFILFDVLSFPFRLLRHDSGGTWKIYSNFSVFLFIIAAGCCVRCCACVRLRRLLWHSQRIVCTLRFAVSRVNFFCFIQFIQ